jgi:hypothetical protein
MPIHGRARALYNRVLELEPPGGGYDRATGMLLRDHQYPLMHGMFCPAYAPKMDQQGEGAVGEGDAREAVERLKEKLREAEQLLQSTVVTS